MVKCRIDLEEPIIVLEPEIEGEGETRTVEMALDTGATYVMIPWDIAEALGYEPEKSKERIKITNKGFEPLPLIAALAKIRGYLFLM